MRPPLRTLGIFFFVYFPSVFGQSCEKLLVTDFSPQDCVERQTLEGDTFYYWLDESVSCVPFCSPFVGDGPGRGDCPCPPGYFCDSRCLGSVTDSEIRCTSATASTVCPRGRCKMMCIANLDSCMAYHANTTEFRYNKFTALRFKPRCEIDGSWQAKQCKGGINGRCLCFDKNGNRLFGQARFLESDEMTCACSRRRADLQDAGRSYVSFHCDSMGNYEKLQCDSGLCWCAEPRTGELASPVVPERAMLKLPCYSVSEIGSQYLRQCDSAKQAMATILDKLKVHGVQFATLGQWLCDGDGGFGAFNVSAGIAYCTWRDGTRIGSWQSDTSVDIQTLNCNCARDYRMYDHMLQCEGSGNYRELQVIVDRGNTFFYCVDSDGFAKSDISTTIINNCEEYY